MQLEVRVLGQQEDEALADGTGAAQDTCDWGGEGKGEEMRVVSRVSHLSFFLSLLLLTQAWVTTRPGGVLTALLGWERRRGHRGGCYFVDSEERGKLEWRAARQSIPIE